MAVGFFLGMVLWNAQAARDATFNAIDSMVLSAFVCAPALAGTLVGAVFGWWKWRRA